MKIASFCVALLVACGPPTTPPGQKFLGVWLKTEGEAAYAVSINERGRVRVAMGNNVGIEPRAYDGSWRLRDSTSLAVTWDKGGQGVITYVPRPRPHLRVGTSEYFYSDDLSRTAGFR